ncbi:hypothetical protein Tco_0863851 [Tanacetum coccineum]
MASRGRRSLPSRLLPDSRPPLRPRPKPPDLNFHRHNVHTVLLLHSPLVLTTIPLPINAIPCDSSTDQENKPLTSSSKLVPRALFHRSRRQGHTRLYRLPSSAKRTESKLPAFPDSSRSFIPQPRLVSHDGQAQSYNPIPIIPVPGDLFHRPRRQAIHSTFFLHM